MHLYVELWKPRAAWNELSDEARQDYLGKVGPGIGQLQEAGVV